MSSTARLLIQADSDLGNAIRDLQRMNSELAETARAAQRAASDVGGAGNGMLGSLRRVAEFTAGGLLSGGITALVGAFGQAASAGMEFGSTINRIQALAGATAGEMGAVEAKALELGAALPLSASQAADGIQELVAGGMSLNDALAAATGTAQLASSQLMPVGQAASIVSAALNSFGLAAGEAGRVSDVLSMAANKSASSVPELGEALKYVGGVAGALSQPIEGTAAAIGLMANAGIQGSMAGTALRATLTELATPSKATASALEQMGVATVNSAGQMRPFMDIAADMRQAMDGMSDSQKTLIANTIAGTPGMAGFLAVLNASPESFNEMRAAMEQATGATAAFGQATGQGAAFALEQLKGSIETVLVQGFRAVEPALVTVLSAVTAFVNQTGAGFAQLTPTIQQFASQAGVGLAQVTAIIDQMQPAVAFVTEHWQGFATALGGFAGLIVGSQVASLIVAVTTAVGSMSAAVTVAGGLLPWIGGLIAALGGPITLIIAALAALAVAYATNFLGIRDLVDQVVTFLNGLWAQHGDQIVGIAQQAWGLIQSAVETALGVVAQLWSAWNSAREGDWRGFGEKLREIWDGAWNAIVSVVSTVGPQVLAAIVSLLGQARDAFTSIDWGELGRNIVAGVAQGITSAAGRVADAARQAAQNALDAARGFLGIQSPSTVMANEVGRPISEGLAAGIMAGAPDAVNAMLWVAGNIASVARQLVWTMKQYGDGMGDALKRMGRLSEGVGAVVSVIDDVAEAVERLSKISQTANFGAGATGWADGIARLARGLIDAMNWKGQGLGNEIERLQALAEGIQAVAGVAGSAQSALESLTAIGQMKPPDLESLKALFGQLATWAAETANATAQAAGSVSGPLAAGLQNLANASQGLQGIAQNTTGTVRALLDSLTLDWAAIRFGQLRDHMAGLATIIVFFSRAVASVAAQMEDIDTSGFGPLSTAAQGLQGIATNTTGVVQALLESLKMDWAAIRFGQLRDHMAGLATIIVFFSRAVASVAAQMEDIDTSGFGPLAQTAQSLQSVAQSTTALVQDLVESLKFDWAKPNFGQLRDHMAGLATIIVFFARAVENVAAQLEEVDTSGFGPLGQVAQSLLSVVQTTTSLITTLAEWVKKPVVVTQAMLEQATTLTQNLVSVFNAFRAGAGQAAPTGVEAAQAWAQTMGPVSQALMTAMDFLPRLAEWTRAPLDLSVVMKYQVEQLALSIRDIFTAFKNSLGTVVPTGVEAAQAWASGMGGVVDALESAMGFLPRLAAWARAPLSVNTFMLNAVGQLALSIYQVFNKFREYLGMVEPAGIDAAQAWANGMGGVVGALESAMSFLPKLAAWAARQMTVNAQMLNAVGLLGLSIWQIFNKFREYLGTVEPAGIDAAQAWQSGMGAVVGALESAMSFLPKLAEWTKKPISLSADMQTQVRTLAENLKAIFTEFKAGAGAALPTGAEAAQAWAQTSGVLSSIETAMSFLPKLAEWVKKPVVLSDTMRAEVKTLAQNLVALFTEFKAGAGAALPTGAEAAQAWAQTSGVLSSIETAMSFLPKLAEWVKKPISLSADMQTQVRTLAENLKAIFTEFKAGVGEVAPTASEAVQAWSTVFGSVMSGLEAGFKLPELTKFLTTFTGFNFTQLQPKLTLLLANMIEIARQFGQAAQNARIDEEWQKAGSVLADLVGKGIGALGQTLDFALKLMDPELMIPSAAQISGKIRAIIGIMNEALQQFAASAGSLQVDQTAATQLATTIKPITDALAGMVQLVQDFNGLNLGMSGYNNLRSFMSMIFDVFGDYAPDADKVQQVVNALTMALGGLGNLMQSLGAQAGTTWAEAFLAAIKAKVEAFQMPQPGGGAPSTAGATPSPLPPAPGQGGGTVVNNYYNFTLNQNGLGDATAGKSAASFLAMKAQIGASP